VQGGVSIGVERVAGGWQRVKLKVNEREREREREGCKCESKKMM